LLQLFENRFRAEWQIPAAVAHGVLLAFAAEDVAQELLHLRVNGLPRQPVDEGVGEARQRILARDEVLLRGLVKGAALLRGEGDSSYVRMRVTDAGDRKPEAVLPQSVYDLLSAFIDRAVGVLNVFELFQVLPVHLPAVGEDGVQEEQARARLRV